MDMQPDSPTSSLSTVETFLSSEHVDSTVNSINNYANIMMNDPHIQAQVNAKNRSVFNQGWNAVIFASYDNNFFKHWEPSANFTQHLCKLSNEKNQKQTAAMTHFTDPNNENCDDSGRKLCYFLETLISNWKYNYTFKEYLAKDEYFSLWKGGLNFTIYIPTKRERFGVKIFMFFEGETGYLLNFIAYTGETTYPCDLRTTKLYQK